MLLCARQALERITRLETVVQQQHQRISKRPLLRLMWKEVHDKASGRNYYYHVETRQTQWNRPEEHLIVNKVPLTYNKEGTSTSSSKEREKNGQRVLAGSSRGNKSRGRRRSISERRPECRLLRRGRPKRPERLSSKRNGSLPARLLRRRCLPAGPKIRWSKLPPRGLRLVPSGGDGRR